MPGGWVISDIPNAPAVSAPDASRSNSEPIAQVAGPSPGARTSTLAVS